MKKKKNNRAMNKVFQTQNSMLDSLKHHDNISEETKILMEEVEKLGGNCFVILGE